mmetsp:Transcript_313/g.31  ORF Transcript_313/g.31 Transcript_313/m.31 type:complete len:100 (-) Transcript_313:417-716(-)
MNLMDNVTTIKFIYMYRIKTRTVHYCRIYNACRFNRILYIIRLFVLLLNFFYILIYINLIYLCRIFPYKSITFLRCIVILIVLLKLLIWSVIILFLIVR